MYFNKKEPSVVFKDIDLIELTKGKTALQSSISRWSKNNDPQRPINGDLDISDYAFHTGKEKDPWWMVDLGEEYPIECIRIKNRKNFQERLKPFKIYYSLNKIDWHYVDSSLYEWEKLDEILIPLNSFINARYIKIVLEGIGYLHFNKIQIFKRKYPGLIVATRYDLFGGRMMAMINAIYLAQKTNFKFGFVWEHRKNLDIDSGFIDDENIVFEKDYIDKYSYTHSIAVCYKEFSFRSFKDIVYGDPEKNWGWISSPAVLLNRNNVFDIDEEDYRNKCVEIWENIQFSSRYKHVIQKAKNIGKNLSNNFIAIHIRSGNTIIDDMYRKIIFHPINMPRVFPIEIAIALIEDKIKDTNIVLFSADFDAINHIKLYFSTTENIGNKVYSSDDFVDEEFTEQERVVFDLVLMSQSNTIYNPATSTYSLLASMIGNTNLMPINKYFNDQERFDFLSKNFDKIVSNNFQKAASCAYKFVLSEKLNKTVEEKIDILNLAYSYDEDNFAYKIIVFDLLFKVDKCLEIENFLKTLDIHKIKDYLYILLVMRFPGAKEPEYKKYFDNYLKYANLKYPYISYVAAKICQYQKNYPEALKYCGYAISNYSENKLFVELADELNHLIMQKVEKKHLQLGAIHRVKNQLSYKLGQIMIKNSKSVSGYFEMPLALLKVAREHKALNKKKIFQSKLKEYDDYQESLKYKSHLSYKLGKSLINAHKNWYKGGYIKFWFDLYKLRKEYKNKGKK